MKLNLAWFTFYILICLLTAQREASIARAKAAESHRAIAGYNTAVLCTRTDPYTFIKSEIKRCR